MDYYKAIEYFLEAIKENLSRVKREQIENFIEKIIEKQREGKKILIIGAGRSGLVGKSFAVRLMHLGCNTYVLGDIVTPPVGEGDLVIAISGSGVTKLVATAVQIAKEVGAEIAVITSFPDSPIGRAADLIIELGGRVVRPGKEDYFASQILGIHEPLMPMGTLFEDSCMILLDAIIADLMQRMGKTEEEMRMRHANIE